MFFQWDTKSNRLQLLAKLVPTPEMFHPLFKLADARVYTWLATQSETIRASKHNYKSKSSHDLGRKLCAGPDPRRTTPP